MAKLLVASDGSACALQAARRAVDLLAPGEVTVLTVVDVRPEWAAGAAGGLLGAEPLAVTLTDPTLLAEGHQAADREANEVLDRTVAALGPAGEGADRLVAHGDPAAEICRVAAEGGFDLVVVGSHGSGLVRRVLTGSVSGHVVHHCAVPVLVVRAPSR